jgi:hypothetical protein
MRAPRRPRELEAFCTKLVAERRRYVVKGAWETIEIAGRKRLLPIFGPRIWLQGSQPPRLRFFETNIEPLSSAMSTDPSGRRLGSRIANRASGLFDLRLTASNVVARSAPMCMPACQQAVSVGRHNRHAGSRRRVQ